jgi:hypothetical protein
MLFTHSTVTIEFPSETAPKIQEVIAEYFARKGAESRAQTNQNTIAFKIKFPLMNFDPINFSRDNFIGINPVVLFQRISAEFFPSSVVITLKGLRLRYLGLLALIVSIILFLYSGDVHGTIAGIVFFLLLEVLGAVAEKVLKHELSSYISHDQKQRGAEARAGSKSHDPQ